MVHHQPRREGRQGRPHHREPEQVKAFRDTWRDGIHSYLTYLRDRLTVVRDLLTDSGSIFVQIGDENYIESGRLWTRCLATTTILAKIGYHSTSGSTSDYLSNPKNYVLWYGKNALRTKFRKLLVKRRFSLEDPGPWQIMKRTRRNKARPSLVQEKHQIPRYAALGWVMQHHSAKEGKLEIRLQWAFLCFSGKDISTFWNPRMEHD